MKMTAGEFRNSQYNEVMKLTGVLALVSFIVTVIAFCLPGSEQLLGFLRAIGTYPGTFLAFASAVMTITLVVVYLMTREQANNKLWLPTENGPTNDYRTQGAVK